MLPPLHAPSDARHPRDVEPLHVARGPTYQLAASKTTDGVAALLAGKPGGVRLSYVAGTLPGEDEPYSHAFGSSFVAAASRAYACEKNLAFRPDDVLHAVLYQIAMHVNANSGAHATMFGGSPDGKQRIVSSVAPSATSVGDSILQTLDILIREKFPANARLDALLSLGFTTTTRDDRIMRAATLMGTVKDHYEFEGGDACGIRQVILHGTKDDWARLRSVVPDAVLAFERDGETRMKRWSAMLAVVLRHFELTRCGAPSVDFWNKIHAAEEVSCGGSADVSQRGWLAAFLVYTPGEDMHDEIEWHGDTKAEGALIDGVQFPCVQFDNETGYPCGSTIVPFMWNGEQAAIVAGANLFDVRGDECAPRATWAMYTRAAQ